VLAQDDQPCAVEWSVDCDKDWHPLLVNAYVHKLLHKVHIGNKFLLVAKMLAKCQAKIFKPE
jgi:hypothetical protein